MLPSSTTGRVSSLQVRSITSIGTPQAAVQQQQQPLFSQGRCHHRSVAASAQQRTKDDAASSSSDKLDVEIFEVAGTPADRSGFEPFSSRNTTAADNTASPSLLESFDFSDFSGVFADEEEANVYDPLRDGPLRYLGYANEVGEAFAAWLFTGGVPLSYAIAIGYVLFDTADKYQKTLKDAEQKLSSRNVPSAVDKNRLIATIGAERGIDTLCWQLIASVAAPGYTIHTVVAAVTAVLREVEKQPATDKALQELAVAVGAVPDVFVATVNKSLPTAIGLAVIPFIVHPIDGAVHALLNATLRPALRSYVCGKAGGAEAGLTVCTDCKQQK